MKRQTLSTMKRLKVFEKAGGRCHICSQRIQAGQVWEVEHVRPLALHGKDDESNMAPAHVLCHSGKTADDVAAIARAKRRKAKHIGIKKASTFPKLPPGYRFDWRTRRPVKIGGGVVRRDA